MTQPSPRTGTLPGSVGRVAIRWMHPEQKTSLLAQGHRFGRDPSCETLLNGPEVSRQHAEVQTSGLVPVIRDLDSRNGVFINGARISQQAIGPQDVIRIGEWVGVAIEVIAEQPAPYQLAALLPGWYATPALSAALEKLRGVARSDLPMVVQGETGSGKEGLARTIHEWSGRRGPFLALDCATLPDNLAEARLFGYRKGAFTGAEHADPGLLRAAHGGTLFFDEVLNLPAPLQAKLLRALEQREVLPLGETRAVPVDVRVVSAAQESLADAAASGRFRPDLMARLEGFTFKLPALRERREDVLPLFLRMLEDRGCQAPRCDPRCAEQLLLYDWPLNVRELLSFARALLATDTAPPFTRACLPERIARYVTRNSATSETKRPQRAAAAAADDFDALVASVRAHQGNLTRAVSALGITRARAYRMLAAHPDFALDALRKGADP